MNKVNPVSLGNALIWAAAILGTVIVLHWFDNESMVLAILGGAAGASITIVSNALRETDSGESEVT
jgi:lipid-A-disaccharide synthase-like uncharacterized protein